MHKFVIVLLLLLDTITAKSIDTTAQDSVLTGVFSIALSLSSSHVLSIWRKMLLLLEGSCSGKTFMLFKAWWQQQCDEKELKYQKAKDTFLFDIKRTGNCHVATSFYTFGDRLVTTNARSFLPFVTDILTRRVTCSNKYDSHALMLGHQTSLSLPRRFQPHAWHFQDSSNVENEVHYFLFINIIFIRYF